MSVETMVYLREGETAGAFGRHGWINVSALKLYGFTTGVKPGCRDRCEFTVVTGKGDVARSFSLFLPLEEFVRFCKEVVEEYDGQES